MDVVFAWDIMHASDAYSRSDTASMSAGVSHRAASDETTARNLSMSGDPGTADFMRVKNPLGNEREWLCRTCAWIPYRQKPEGGRLFVRGELDVNAVQQCYHQVRGRGTVLL